MYPGATCVPGCGEATGGPVVKDCESFCMWFSDATQLDDGVKTTLAEDSPFRNSARNPPVELLAVSRPSLRDCL